MSLRLCMPLLLVLGLCWVPDAHAGDWDTTCSKETLEKHLRAAQMKVVVVAAGPHAKNVDAAASALKKSLRKMKNVSLVMSDESLDTKLGALDDATIVDRCGALPVNSVAVVRVFPGATENEMSMVLVVYDKQKEVLLSLNGRQGEALSPVERTIGLQPVAKTVHPGDTARTSAQQAALAASPGGTNSLARYEAKAVSLDGTTIGKYGKPLTPDQFYEIVGREDLALTYKKRSRTKNAIVIGGSALGIAGLVVMFVPLMQDDPNWAIMYAGIGMMTVGMFGSLYTMLLFKEDPVAPHEKMRLADEHNQSLREEYGLTDTAAAAAQPRPLVSQFVVSPMALHRGAGLGMNARF